VDLKGDFDRMTDLQAYMRVSTKRQNRENDTIQNQRRSIERYCATKGYRVVEWYKDPEMSGANRDRPDFKRMLSEIDCADGIVVYDVSRIVRDEDLGEDVMRLMRDKHKMLHQSLTGAFYDFNDAGSRMMFKFWNWYASQERERILARQREGLDRAKDNGKHLGRAYKTINWNRYDELKEAEISNAGIARLLDISPKTLYRRLKERRIV
jgi:putative DNA-invertase from lambdoid prophage Rac